MVIVETTHQPTPPPRTWDLTGVTAEELLLLVNATWHYAQQHEPVPINLAILEHKLRKALNAK